MAVKAKAEITLYKIISVDKVVRYYLLQSSTLAAPSKPADGAVIGSNWSKTEPSYTSGSTSTLYFVDQTVLSNGTLKYSEVSKSSNYEAAKEAWNKANNAQKTADSANSKIDGLQVGGRNLARKTSSDWSSWIIPVANKVNTCASLTSIYPGDKKVGDIFTITFDIEVKKFTAGSGGTFNIFFQGAVDGAWKVSNPFVNISPVFDFKTKALAGDFTERVSATCKIINDNQASAKKFDFDVRCDYSDGTGKYRTKNLKVEKGNKATDWTPAPEDFETRVSAAETAISNNAKEIKLKASQYEVTAISDNLKLLTKTSTEFKQTVEGWQFNWDKLISTDNAEVASHQDYITFDKGDIILGESSNDLKLKITNDSIQFKGTSDTEVTPDKDATAWITGKTFHISDGEIQNSLKFGDILMKPTSSGNLAIDDYAEFGPTVRIGNPSSRYTRINSNGLMVNNENTVIAQIGYGTAGDPNGGNSVYAFYTFGERKTGTLSGGYSLVEGFNNTATGFCAHAEGWSSIASGTSAHAEGSSTASGDDSHAEGGSTTASGDDSHAEGGSTTASGQSSHAEGEHTEASEIGAHAEGSYTKAMGAYSHAEGGSTTASGDYSHAGGVGTIAKNDYQTVIGRYNANKNSAFIIGNGSSDTERSNALTVDWDGNITGKSLTSANDLKLGFGSSNIFKPYFTKGDSITLTIYAVGYVTTRGKEVAMYVPLSRPIIAGGSVSVASVNGLTIRQNGKYLYSSSASNSVNPSSFRAAIVGSGCGVNIVATFGNTVNATVNDVCSITASIKITFS